MVGWHRSRSELPYLVGVGLAVLGSFAWLFRLHRRLKSADSVESDVLVRLVLFLVAKAVLLALEVTMLCGAWSGMGTGWYIALAILCLDLPAVCAGGYMWKRANEKISQFQAESLKKCKERRSEYLEMLPRLSFQDFCQSENEKEIANENDNDMVNERVPDEKHAGNQEPSKAEQDQCVICLADFKPDCTVVRLDCGHVFHEGCISTWLIDEKRDPCPFRCTNFPADLVRVDREETAVAAASPTEITPNSEVVGRQLEV